MQRMCMESGLRPAKSRSGKICLASARISLSRSASSLRRARMKRSRAAVSCCQVWDVLYSGVELGSMFGIIAQAFCYGVAKL